MRLLRGCKCRIRAAYARERAARSTAAYARERTARRDCLRIGADIASKLPTRGSGCSQLKSTHIRKRFGTESIRRRVHQQERRCVESPCIGRFPMQGRPRTQRPCLSSARVALTSLLRRRSRLRRRWRRLLPPCSSDRSRTSRATPPIRAARQALQDCADTNAAAAPHRACLRPRC